MQTLLVVELDVVNQGLTELLIASERFFVEPLDLEGMEERLHVCVVVHRSGSIHALDEAMLSEFGFEIKGCVFDAPI